MCYKFKVFPLWENCNMTCLKRDFLVILVQLSLCYLYSFRACIFNIIRGPGGTGVTEVHATYLRYVEFFFSHYHFQLIFSFLILLVLALIQRIVIFSRITSCRYFGWLDVTDNSFWTVIRARAIKMIELIYSWPYFNEFLCVFFPQQSCTVGYFSNEYLFWQKWSEAKFLNLY